MIISVTVLILIGWFIVDNQHQTRKQDLQIYRNFLVQEAQRLNQAFSQLTSVSDLLKKNPVVINVLDQHAKGHTPPRSAALIVAKNLAAIASIHNISSVFLMDLDGQCVYSSKKKFVGKNYGFRPYFKAAITHGSGLYAAMGVTSQQPGIYYAQAVVNGTHPLGVAVVKIKPAFFDLHSLLSVFSRSAPSAEQFRMGITTAEGIFLDANNSFLSSLETLSTEQVEALRKSRQFPPERIQSLEFSAGSLDKLLARGFLRAKNSSGTEYFLFKEPLISKDLYLLHIIDAQWFRDSYRPVSSSYRTLMYLMGGILAVLISFLFFLNRQHLAMLAAAEEIRKETRQRMKEKRKYEAIINRNPEGFCLFDAESKTILEVNSSFCQLLGKHDEQVVGRQVDDFFAVDGEESALVPDSSQESPVGFERHLELGENSIDILVHSGAISDPDNQKKECFYFIADITERKKEQEKLLLFSRVVEQSPSGIIITSEEGRIVYSNPAFTRITGYTAEEVLGQSPSVLSSGETNPETIKILWEVISSGKNWKGYLRNRKKDGTLYWEGQTIAPVFDNQQNISHYFAIKNDITERITLEERIASKTAELELIVEHVAIGISYIIDHHFLWVSKAGAEIFGYEDEKEVAGLPTEAIFESREAYESTIQRAAVSFAAGNVFEDEQVLKKKDGTLFWCALIGKVVNPDDFSEGAIWLTQDISAQKEVEKQLQLARDRAQQSNREKSSFLANMSHEIRTPMNSIIGMSRLALDTPLDPQQKYLLNTIRHSADFLLALINDILDFSKIESGRFELDDHPFRLETVITQILQTMEFLAKKKGVHLKSSIAPKAPQFVAGDELRLRQILHNLVGNAIKFTETGEIWIRVSSGKVEDNAVILDFQVQDTGIGIAPEKLETIFDSFVQADTSISRDFGGTGLGLAISSKLCRLMGGDIQVVSEPGKGSTFSFSVKLRGVSSQELNRFDEEKSQGALQDTPLRMLLVDDNAANRYLAQAIFKKADHQVVEAENGMEALEVLLDHHFDVILMDVQMPVLDGITTTQIIRDCENNRGESPEQHLSSGLSGLLRSRLLGGHIPVVALTAHALSEDRQQCLGAGMDGYAVKPFKSADIYHAIQQAIASLEGEGDELGNFPRPVRIVENGEGEPESSPVIAGIIRHLREVYELDNKQREEMLHLSSVSLGEIFEQAEKALAESDMASVRSCAHKAKGVLLGLGLDKESKKALKIENFARESNRSLCRKLFRDLQRSVAPVLEHPVES